MKGFKYRANIKLDNGQYRDIESLLKHELYASTFLKLNDPFEGTFDDKINEVIQKLKKLPHSLINEIEEQWRTLQNTKSTLGIYSMEIKSGKSDIPINELLWAHYANGHKGFCIEYDIDKLLSSHTPYFEINKVNVSYQENCPELTIEDISDTEIFLNKMFGTKSRPWIYENEIRLVYDNSGIKTYHPSALKNIYFGVNMDVQNQNDIIKGLENYDIHFYKMGKIDGSYKLKATLIAGNKRHITDRLSNRHYKILKTTHEKTVENFHVLLLTDQRDKLYLQHFADKFREEYATKPSNILLYDDIVIYDLIGKFPLTKNEEELYDEHLIAMSTFDAPEIIWIYHDKK